MTARQPQPYDLRTLEMVLAWCEREERAIEARLAVDRADLHRLLTSGNTGALKQVERLRNAIKRHAAKARRK